MDRGANKGDLDKGDKGDLEDKGDRKEVKTLDKAVNNLDKADKDNLDKADKDNLDKGFNNNNKGVKILNKMCV